MNIRAEYICPPFPIRDFDWEAVDADTYDPEGTNNKQIGYGKTKEEAIADLLRQIEEANDDGA